MAICLNKNSQAVKNLIAEVGVMQAESMVGAISNGFLPLIKVDGKLVPEPRFKALQKKYGDFIQAWDEFLKLYEPKQATASPRTINTTTVSNPNSHDYLRGLGNRKEVSMSELSSYLKSIGKNASNIILTKLDAINLGQDISVKFLTTSEIREQYPYDENAKIQLTDSLGAYIPEGMEPGMPRHIIFNTDYLTDKAFKKIAVHEMLHAYSVEHINKTNNPAFTNFFKETKRELIDKGFFSENEYMLSDEKEFLVALFTEKDLVSALKELKPIKPNFKTRWAEFINFVKNFLNIGTQNISRLDEAISEAVDVINQQGKLFNTQDQIYQDSNDNNELQEETYNLKYSSANPINNWTIGKLEDRIVNTINAWSKNAYGHNALIKEQGRYRVYAGNNNAKKLESLRAIQKYYDSAENSYTVAGFDVTKAGYITQPQYVVMNPLELSTIISQQGNTSPSFAPLSEAKVEEELVTEEVLLKTIGRLKKRMRILEAKKKDLSVAETKEIEALEELYGSSKYFQGLLEFSVNSQHSLQEQYETLEDMRFSLDQELANISPSKSSKVLRDAHTYFAALNPIILSIKGELGSAKFKAEVAKEYGQVGITNEITDVIALLEDNLGKLKVKLEDIEALYYKLSVPIFAKYLSNFTAGSGLNIDSIQEMLKSTNADISFWQRWLFSMADSSDDVLRMINESVGQAKDRARLTTIDNKRDLINWQNELKESGNKNYDWMYDKTDGEFNGFLIDKYKWGDFVKAEADFLNSINKKYKVKNKDEAETNLSATELKKYKYEISRWYTLNTQYNKANEARLLAEKKLELGEEAYALWLDNHTRVDNYTGITTITMRVPDSKKSFVLPAEKFRNTSFDNMTPAQLKFYDRITGLKEKLDSQLPSARRNRLLPPQIRKDFVEKAKEVRSLDEAKAVASDLWASYEVVDNYERGNEFVLTDSEGKMVDLLPVKFSSRMKDPALHMSRDIVSGMTIYSAMANDFGELDKIIDVLELGKDVISAREMNVITSKGNIATEAMKVLGKRVEETVSTKGNTSNVARRLEDYFQMVVYGKYKASSNKTILGKDQDKVIDLLGQYTAINGLAFNLFAGFANIGFGNIMIRTEAMAGQYINNKALLQGSMTYWKHLPGAIANIGKVDQQDKLNLWMEYFNTLQDYESALHEVDSLRKGRLSKLFKMSSMFFINNVGEHFMQTRMSLSMAAEVKLKDSSGKEINLFEAFEVRNGKLVLKEGVRKLDGSEWTQKDTISFIRKQNFVNKRLHGIYNYVDRSAVQQHAIGRLAMMFKKFIIPGLVRRYQSKQYSFEGQTDTEGFYLTAMEFFGNIVKDLKGHQYNTLKTYNNMEPWQRANVNRFLAELMSLIGTAILAAFVFDGDDDKDDWALNMAAYQVNRIYTEIGFYNPITAPTEALKIIKTPVASVNTVQDVLTFMGQLMPWNFTDEISKGKFEGWYKWQKGGFKMLPGVHQLYDLTTPEEKLKYFTFTK